MRKRGALTGLVMTRQLGRARGLLDHTADEHHHARHLLALHGCRGGVEIRWGEYAGLRHEWPAAGTSAYADLETRIWDVFATFPMP